ncbi:MAG: amino acid permease [Gammaproteobacteria bacterium]
MLAPDIYSGMGVGPAMAKMVGGGTLLTNVVAVMLLLALLLCIMTAMAGSSRTLLRRPWMVGCHAIFRTLTIAQR